MQCQYKHKKDFFVDIRKADSNIYMKKQKKKNQKKEVKQVFKGKNKFGAIRRKKTCTPMENHALSITYLSTLSDFDSRGTILLCKIERHSLSSGRGSNVFSHTLWKNQFRFHLRLISIFLYSSVLF